MCSYKPVKQGQPGFKAELLAGDTVNQGLKDRREAWRPHATEPEGEIVEVRILTRDPVKRGKLDIESEHVVQDAMYQFMRCRGCRSLHVNVQVWPIQAPTLGHGKLDRSIIEKYCPPVGGAVPSIDLID
jgi:hypothetical protein